jgi:predicted double-glycine peptidase
MEKSTIVITNNNLEEFINNHNENFKDKILEYIKTLKYKINDLIEDNKDIEHENYLLKEENKRLEYYNDEFSKEYENMVKFGYSVTMLDDMKTELIKDNWYKFSFDQLDNFIKTL